MQVYEDITQLVGNTPILHLNRIEKAYNCQAKLYAKVEKNNVAGSIKDRVAKNMIEKALEQGIIKEGSTIIEPTSGNTGIALAAIACAKGIKMIATMPESMSVERRNMIKAYGAQIVLTPASEGMKGAIAKANELCEEIEGATILAQFDNPENPNAHYLTTGVEIYEQMDGKVDIFVSAIGTGGTISGTSKYLKEQNPNIKVVGIEPSASPFLSQGKTGPHKIQGIGAGFLPNTLDQNAYDELITVSDEDAYTYARACATNEGLFIGISAGSALCAAIQLAQLDENKDKNIVIIFPDGGDRYLSSGIVE